MSLIELRKDATRQELAWFGLLLLVFCVLLGIIVWRATGTFAVSRYIWAAGLALSILYYAVPPLRVRLFAGWMYASYPIAWVVSHVLLAAIYFGLLTPFGLVMRLVGYDPLRRRLDKDATSYWTERERVTDVTRYFRQF